MTFLPCLNVSKQMFQAVYRSQRLFGFVFSQYCFAFASLLLYCNTSAIYRPKKQLMYASMGAFIKGWLQKDLKLYIQDKVRAKSAHRDEAQSAPLLYHFLFLKIRDSPSLFLSEWCVEGCRRLDIYQRSVSNFLMFFCMPLDITISFPLVIFLIGRFFNLKFFVDHPILLT